MVKKYHKLGHDRCITVGELVRQLEKFDPEWPVVRYEESWGKFAEAAYPALLQNEDNWYMGTVYFRGCKWGEYVPNGEQPNGVVIV